MVITLEKKCKKKKKKKTKWNIGMVHGMVHSHAYEPVVYLKCQELGMQPASGAADSR